MNFKNGINYDIKYLIKLKEDFYMPNTTIKHDFCASIENIADGHIYFKLNGCCALVIIPTKAIEWMAPSKVLWEKEHGQLAERSR